MRVMQAYRFALDPSGVQERMLRSHAGAARFAWNWGLARCRERYESEGRWYLAAELRLRCVSRAHSRKQQGSVNRRQAAARLARLHARIANIRGDALHKAGLPRLPDRSVSVLDSPAERPAGFDLASFWEEWTALFEAGLPSVAVR
jgi:transposase